MSESLSTIDVLALGSTAGGAMSLIYRRDLVRERFDGPGIWLFLCGLGVVGGLSWFICKAFRARKSKKV